MNYARLLRGFRQVEGVIQRFGSTPISKAIVADPPIEGVLPTDPDRMRWTLVELALSDAPVALIQRWQALNRHAPDFGADSWFRITRALARHLDITAVATWLNRTRDDVAAVAPDKLRVERYVDLFTHAYAREVRDWRGESCLLAVHDEDPPAIVHDDATPARLHEMLAREMAEGTAQRWVISQPATPPRPRIPSRLQSLRDDALAKLGWSSHAPGILPPSELLSLPEVRFTAYRHDNRGGLIFDGDKITPRLCNEHYMLDMTGHAVCKPAERRETLAFAPVSACPLNHYHELMDTFASLVFHDLLPPGTPIVVPKRYEVLRPLYEAAGIDWSTLREYAELDTTVFDRVIAPLAGASRANYPAFFAKIASRLATEGTRRNRRFYLSRRKISNRPLTNEAEIETLAMRHGFEIIHTQNLDFLTQCRLMAEAAILLGPHGAAFSNLLFAPPDALIIEIICPDYKVPCTYEMATECSQQYLPIVGNGFHDAVAGDFSWSVDPDLIESTLTLAIADASAEYSPTTRDRAA